MIAPDPSIFPEENHYNPSATNTQPSPSLTILRDATSVRAHPRLCFKEGIKQHAVQAAFLG